MGWHEDHRNAVAERWAKKFHESKMTEEQFTEYMKEFMLKGSWDKTDIDLTVKQAIKKGGEF